MTNVQITDQPVEINDVKLPNGEKLTVVQEQDKNEQAPLAL